MKEEAKKKRENSLDYILWKSTASPTYNLQLTWRPKSFSNTEKYLYHNAGNCTTP